MWRAEAGLGLVVFGEFVEGETGTTQTNIWKTETLLGAAGAQFTSRQFPFQKLHFLFAFICLSGSFEFFQSKHLTS